MGGVLETNPDVARLCPLCRYGHSGRQQPLPKRHEAISTTRWARVWSILAAMEEQILDAPAPRTAEQVVDVLAAGEVMEDRVQQRLVEPMIEAHKDSSKDQILQSRGADSRVSWTEEG